MIDDCKVLLDQLREYIKSHTIDEMLLAGLKHFFNTNKNVTLEDISLKYDKEIFNELGEPLSYFRENIEDISEHFYEYEKVYRGIKEEKSRKVFLNMLASKVYMDLSYVGEAYDTEDIYFDPSIWDQLINETYVDCGGYIGDTALSFICHCPSYKNIYVLEPFEESENICRKNLDWFINEGKTNILKVAAFDKETSLPFTKNHGTGDSRIDSSGEIRISATTLDGIIKEPVSFIKMDIEGSEKAALEGARQHIVNETPKLAVCVYHLKDDFWKIPQLILDINPEYNFIFRQHRPDVYTETVLYAVPRKNAQDKTSILDSMVKLERLNNAFSNIRIISSEEYKNLIENIKDKSWYLYQIRMHNEEISRLNICQNNSDSIISSQKQGQLSSQREWIQELETAKEYLEGQSENYQNEVARLSELLTEQKAWSDQLLEGKNYLEGHAKELSKEILRLQKALSDQQEWSQQLQEGKDYLGKQVQIGSAEIERLQDALTEQKNWSEQLQEGKNYLEEQVKIKDKELSAISTELENQLQWGEKLQAGKEYLETQLGNYQKENEQVNKYLEEQKNWSVELQTAKEYLENTLKKREAEVSEANRNLLQAETELSELQNELAKTKYKLSKLLNDTMIKKIIKFKKIEL